MAQNKREQENITLTNMIFFQNLVPGQPQSPLLDHYKSTCINIEENDKLKQQREELLREFPPILSFRDEQQKKKFYEDEAKNCRQFCCGGMSPTSAAYMDDVSFSPKDDYVFSAGNGPFYEGSKKSIGDAIKQDVAHEPFGSSSQQALITGLQTFDKTVAQRNQASISVETDAPVLSEVKSISPFDTTPKPKDK